MQQLAASTSVSARPCGVHRFSAAVVQRRQHASSRRLPGHHMLQASKGFAADTDGKAQSSKQEDSNAAAASAPSTSASAVSSADDATIEALEARLKSRRAKGQRLEPKVKVESAAVDQATGKSPATAVGEFETKVVQALGALFALVLVEGLVLAASGFLPEDLDAVVSDYLYPSYSPQILLFLACSSLYGLWKVGKLPGQKQL